MKILLILLTFLTAAPTYAQNQDCYNCYNPWWWSWFRPIPEEPEWPIEYVKVDKIDYERNEHATYCKRPVEMVDTIVIHHSETPSTDSPQRINEYHLQRGSAADPWLMIGYSYTINSPYPGASNPSTKVAEGRPLDIVGAHAGTNIFMPTDSVQKKLWDEGKITCGNEQQGFRVNPATVRNDRIKANVTTIGLVVVGNYSPFSKNNPNGYSKKNPRYPTKDTQDLIARMSCQLQKKHPRMKNIKWHNYYHATSCPGTIKQYIGQIKTLARKYGCEFN